MKKNWSNDELEEFWNILPEEKDLLRFRQGIQTFFFVLLLKHYLHEKRFLDSAHNLPHALLEYGYIKFGVIVSIQELEVLLLNVRNCNRYKSEIREFLGIKLFKNTQREELSRYLYKLAFETKNEEKIEAEAKLYLWQHKIEFPNEVLISNLVRNIINKFDKYLFEYINTRITQDSANYIDNTILSSDETTGETILSFLKQDSGKSNRDSISVEIEKLQIIKKLDITASIIPQNISTQVLKFYKRKILSYTPEQIRRKFGNIKYPLVIIFCYLKQQELMDNLADHLINFIHKIKKKADKAEFAINSEIGRLQSGINSLYLVAEVARDKPNDIIQDAIYPIVSREQIDALVRARYLVKTLKATVRNKIIRSYSIYYRKKIFEILNNIEIKSSNTILLSALDIVTKYQNDKREFYPYDDNDNIPIEGLINKNDMEFIFHGKSSGKTIGNVKAIICRKEYEYTIFKNLRESLKNKGAWLEGSLKYRNPEYDVPEDFDNNKDYYYNIINQSLSAQEFVDTLKTKLSKAIRDFDNNFSKNEYVKIVKRKNKPWIKLSPVPEQPKPQNLDKLKNDISSKWNTINLLDILKEVDLRENFTSCFKSVGNREVIPQEEIQKRLILSLFAIGTNTGLTSMSSACTNNVSFEELRHIKRKFINQEDLRESITKVVDAIFRIRNTDIWGNATTTCASDSKKFTSWDQNLTTEWHARYKGAGVMIYWHVNSQSICVYSQLKTCSSSEVASMLQGVISQETDMTVESQYVDSHGKSECGFALTYLLGFDLLPRYKEIGRQKIYLSDEHQTYKNITDITTRSVNWELILTQYDEMIKFAAGLKVGIATADSIIRQFSKSNYQHPVFKAFLELGKAVKSVFLCRYLGSLGLRQEIHSALNIVENWNSVNRFIFYGKNGEISSNSRDEQEYSMLCLHLLQICLAYINTLLIQDILKEESWQNRLKTEDLRALTPLIYQHINPYGTFELDMNDRIPLSEVVQ